MGGVIGGENMRILDLDKLITLEEFKDFSMKYNSRGECSIDTRALARKHRVLCNYKKMNIFYLTPNWELIAYGVSDQHHKECSSLEEALEYGYYLFLKNLTGF